MPKTFIQSVGHQLTFADNIKTNQKLIKVTDNLDFIWTFFDVNPQTFFPKDFIPFKQTIKVSGVKRKITISQHLNLSHKLTRLIEKIIVDHLQLTQPEPPIKDNILFVQTVIIDNSIPFSDTLFFYDTLTYNRNLHLFLTDNILLRSYSHGWKIPFKGRASDQIYIDPLPIVHTSQVTFTQSDNKTFALFRPSFGNEYKTQFNHIQRESRGRTLILAGNDTYPYVKSIKSIHMIFEYMKQQEGAGFLAFINNNLGKPVIVSDHEGILFNGIITSPELELTQQDKNNFSTEFDMELIL